MCAGEFNTSLQLRWFLLFDLDDDEAGSVLRYYDGKNAVTRVHKGDIKINPQEVSAVRTFGWESGAEKKLGVRITTSSRVWELVSWKNDAEARQWAELLDKRIRRKVRRPTMATMAEATEAQAAASIGVKQAGVVPTTTRL